MSTIDLDDVIPLHLSDLTFPVGHPLAGDKGEIFAFALRHATGLLLYETGIGVGNDALDKWCRVVHHPIEEALAAHGHDLGDVRLIVNSHLHWDHCGNNRRFPGVPIYTQATELEASRRDGYTIPEFVDFDGAEYVVVDGDAQVARGVRVMSTPGHSPGHQSLIVDMSIPPLDGHLE